METLRQLFKDVLLYSEAIFLPELATYETEVFAATVIIGFVVLLGECQLSRKLAMPSLGIGTSFTPACPITCIYSLLQACLYLECQLL